VNARHGTTTYDIAIWGFKIAGGIGAFICAYPNFMKGISKLKSDGEKLLGYLKGRSKAVDKEKGYIQIEINDAVEEAIKKLNSSNRNND
jgi:hypothetical protein